MACWFRCLASRDDQGAEIPLVDPMADPLGERARRVGPNPRALLEIRELFGEVLPRDRRFLDCLNTRMRNLYKKGARAALELLLESGPLWR